MQSLWRWLPFFWRDVLFSACLLSGISFWKLCVFLFYFLCFVFIVLAAKASPFKYLSSICTFNSEQKRNSVKNKREELKNFDSKAFRSIDIAPSTIVKNRRSYSIILESNRTNKIEILKEGAHTSTWDNWETKPYINQRYGIREDVSNDPRFDSNQIFGKFEKKFHKKIHGNRSTQQ